MKEAEEEDGGTKDADGAPTFGKVTPQMLPSACQACGAIRPEYSALKDYLLAAGRAPGTRGRHIWGTAVGDARRNQEQENARRPEL